MCIYKRSVSYKGAVDWNGLNPAMRNIDSYLNFKNIQKNWLKEHN